MKSILLLICFYLAIQGFSQNLQNAQGTVFHDLNANGLLDAGEPGVAAVSVSNGSDVVLTDESGKYAIPVSDDAIVFVIKPSDYNYPVNAYMLPQFYYIHKPEGSPKDLKYAGIAPTGPLPESIDFALLSGDASEQFSIIVFSDPQSYTEEQIDFYNRSIVEELVGVKGHTFGITLGDIVGDNLSFFEPTNAATARIGLPWFHVFGNHDMNFDAEIQEHADETFESVYGPATYAFNQGKVHFIVLNDVIYPNNLTDRFYVGGLRESQFAFIQNTLRHVPTDNLVVLCMHIPLYDLPEYSETFVESHRQRLFDLLENHPHSFSMSGHMHRQMHLFIDSTGHWPHEQPHHHYTVGTSSGDWWSGELRSSGTPDATMYDGTPQGYNIISFDGNSYSYDYKVYGEPETYKMRIYGPKVVPHNQHFRGEFYVNFFQGSEMDTVEFSVNGGEWKPMFYRVEQDPTVTAMRYLWDHAETLPEGTRPSNPALCYHLWKARVPTNVNLGENTIQIRVKDHEGRIFTDEYVYKAVKLDGN
jgi:hypothetical protein